MKPKQLIRLAIKIIRKYQLEEYGFSARYHADKFQKWNECNQLVEYLETLK